MSAFTIGLDLGQGADYSALAVVERVLELPAGVSLADAARRPHEVSERDVREVLDVVALKRWELGTSYTTVAAEVIEISGRPQFADDATLYFDRGGVGWAVSDLLVNARARGDHAGWCHGVIATSGQQENGLNVPKRNLVAALQVPLETGRLRIARGLPLGDVLERELLGFQQKITDAGREVIEFARHGDGHGDLVSALMLAAWGRSPGRPRLIERRDNK